ncbi:MAG: O-antigen ligase family protein [Bacteroidales bacterium]|nr:O-antigen ligase family protein [Candidatus Cryptobacteroides onthequi]
MKIRDSVKNWRSPEVLMVAVMSVWLLYETAFGMAQVFGLAPSNHAAFVLTGHFHNPGPFGGFVCVLASVTAAYSFSLWKRRPSGLPEYLMLALTSSATLMSMVILPATQSRTAFAAAASAILVYLLRHRSLWAGVRHPRRMAAMVLACITVSAVALFLVKKDSAIGRFHIWRIEARVIAEHPIAGVGEGLYLGAYGEEQARFFAEQDRSALVKRVAGCPEYAFSEYMRVGMEHGLPAMLGFILLTGTVIAVLLRRDSSLAYGALALAVFAGASYPFSLWQFKILALLFLFHAISLLFTHPAARWVAAVAGVMMVLLLFRSGRICDEPKPYREIYDHAYTYFESGDYSKALPLLQKGSSMSSDPMFHNIMGRCYEAQGLNEKAEEEYLMSHDMVPGRLYPLVLLKELYEKQGEISKASEVLREIRSIPLNPRNPNMLKLLQRAEEGGTAQAGESNAAGPG